MTAKTGEILYTTLADQLSSHPATTISVMFGKRCLKVKGKAFASLWENSLVIKVGQPRVQALLKAKTGLPFDPSGLNRPMKEWVMVPLPAANAPKKWLALAQEARTFVESQLK
jgi:hypothetical protein